MSAEWRVRPIRKTQKDRNALAAFRCADLSVPWQAEVETFVQAQLFDWRYAPLAEANDPRALLLFDAKTNAFVGVAAHERIVLGAGGDVFHATKLEVVALANEWQGKTFATGARASDVLMSAVMSDITARVPPRFARVIAVVHEANERSLRVCRRYGFSDELSRVDELSPYRRLVTAHR